MEWALDSFDLFFGLEVSADVSERGKIGFSDDELRRTCEAIPQVSYLISQLVSQGFRYGGDTKSDSKAYTDVTNRKIYIKKDKTIQEACLSLAYELINAQNAKRYGQLFKEFLSESRPTQARAIEYAGKILYIEAEAVYYRSAVAIELGIESAVKNPKFNTIVVDSKGDRSHAIPKLWIEMVKSGKVHRGTKRAFDHYVGQYAQYNRADPHTLVYTT